MLLGMSLRLIAFTSKPAQPLHMNLEVPHAPSTAVPGGFAQWHFVVLRCHKAKPFSQVDGVPVSLPPPNTVVRRGHGDR
jgi:hypothetical protein